MGNWRTVTITGTMSEADARALREVLDYRDDYAWDGWSKPYACLGFSSSRPGLAGLGAWPAAEMNRTGNLAERDYTVEDVADGLRALMPVAPTMLLKVHCGGDYESTTCAATITVGKGLVVVGKPEVADIGVIPEEQMMANLFRNLAR